MKTPLHPNRQRGSAMLVVIALMVVMVTISLTVLGIITHEYTISRSAVHWSQALYTAEAGIEYAWNEINLNTDVRKSSTNSWFPTNLGWVCIESNMNTTNIWTNAAQTLTHFVTNPGETTSTFEVTVKTWRNNNPDPQKQYRGPVIIESRGRVPFSVGWRQDQTAFRNVRLTMSPITPYSKAMLAKGTIIFRGNACSVDSYQGTYSATNRGYHGDIGALGGGIVFAMVPVTNSFGDFMFTNVFGGVYYTNAAGTNSLGTNWLQVFTVDTGDTNYYVIDAGGLDIYGSIETAPNTTAITNNPGFNMYSSDSISNTITDTLRDSVLMPELPSDFYSGGTAGSIYPVSGSGNDLQITNPTTSTRDYIIYVTNGGNNILDSVNFYGGGTIRVLLVGDGTNQTLTFSGAGSGYNFYPSTNVTITTNAAGTWVYSTNSVVDEPWYTNITTSISTNTYKSKGTWYTNYVTNITTNIWGTTNLVVSSNWNESVTYSYTTNIYPAPTVELYVSNCNMHYSGNFDTLGSPTNFTLFGLGGVTDLEYTGNANYKGLVNAPGAEFKIAGNVDFFGAIIGSNITMNGNCQFHYDENLQSYGDIIYYKLTSWEEFY